MLKVNAFLCLRCSTLMYSRARHDFRSCPCGDITVDGGLDYGRTLYKSRPPLSIEFSVPHTKEQLYDDWNKRTDRYGVILNYQQENNTISG